MSMTGLELINNLLDSSLHTLMLGQENSVVVENTHFDALLVALNEGLSKLYDRFSVDVVKGYISLVQGTYTYDLALLEDFGKLISLRYNEEQLPMDESTGIFMKNYHEIYVPSGFVGSLGIDYKKKSKKITKANIDEMLPINLSMCTALSNYITYKMLMLSASDNSRSLAGDYLKLFESQCIELVNTDTLNSSSIVVNSKFTRNGWI